MYEKMYKYRDLLVVVELMVLAFTTYLARIKMEYQVSSAIFLMVLAFFCCFLGRKKKKYILFYVSTILNTIATGVTMCIYFTEGIGFDIDAAVMATGVSITLYLICSIILAKYNDKPFVKVIIMVFLVALLLVDIIAWITGTNNFLYSYVFLFLCFIIVLLLAYFKKINKRDYIKSFVILHFVVFFIVAIVVSIIASEGEILGDIGGVGSVSSKKKKNQLP